MLTFNLKKEWFEKIKSSEKTREYRVFKPYWTKRLLKVANLEGLTKSCVENCIKNNNQFSVSVSIPVKFVLGYPPPSEKNKILYGQIKRLSLLNNGLHTDLKYVGQVYELIFELIKA